MGIAKHFVLWLLITMLAACTSASVQSPPGSSPVFPEEPLPPAPPILTVPPIPQAFASRPEWASASIMPGRDAFVRSCEMLAFRPPGESLSPRALWAGRVSDWQGVCAAMENAVDELSARRILEALMVPVEVSSDTGESRFTGYFEPLIEARRTPVHPFTAPVPGPPGDLIADGERRLQRLPGGRLVAYPPRAEITPVNILGYAHPADVFFLQIQGSGRLYFGDGSVIRAAYHAHNGRPFRSTANWLLERGQISPGQASMQGIRAWMDSVGEAERNRAMNANPRYVFFEPRPVGSGELGPEGAMGVALTPLGSFAVDDRLHAYGVPYLVATRAPGLGGEWSGLMVAQDTGGAIRGQVRGDLFFGTGPQAGRDAGTMNAPGRMWALLPRAVAARLPPSQPANEIAGEPVAAYVKNHDPSAAQQE